MSAQGHKRRPLQWSATCRFRYTLLATEIARRRNMSRSRADRFLQQVKLIDYQPRLRSNGRDGTARFARLQGEELVKGMLSCRETQLAGRFVVADSLRVARG